MPVYI